MIKVRITENRMGHIEISPVSKGIAKLVPQTAYIQIDYEIWDFIESHPKARFGRKNEFGHYQVNDGAIFCMDEEEFFGMVGVCKQ